MQTIRTILTIMFGLLWSATAVAATTDSPDFSVAQPSDLNFTQFSAKYKNMSIKYYVYGGETELSASKPVLVYLQGSGHTPLFYKSADGANATSIILSPKMIKDRYHFVVIQKPGTSFSGHQNQDATSEYLEKSDNEFRANYTNAVINDLVKRNFVDKNRVVLFGHSEGAQIAPYVAFLNKRVTHLICLSGTAINQMYDFLTIIRKQVRDGKLTTEAADREIVKLFDDYKAIIKEPTTVTKNWKGHTYSRWSSALNHYPLQYMLKLNIPIYVAVGTEDMATSIENMDNIPIEFLKAGKSNLTYKWYWGLDHVFMNRTSKDPRESSSKLKDVLADSLSWLEKVP